MNAPRLRPSRPRRRRCLSVDLLEDRRLPSSLAALAVGRPEAPPSDRPSQVAPADPASHGQADHAAAVQTASDDASRQSTSSAALAGDSNESQKAAHDAGTVSIVHHTGDDDPDSGAGAVTVSNAHDIAAHAAKAGDMSTGRPGRSTAGEASDRNDQDSAHATAIQVTGSAVSVALARAPRTAAATSERGSEETASEAGTTRIHAAATPVSTPAMVPVAEPASREASRTAEHEDHSRDADADPGATDPAQFVGTRPGEAIELVPAFGAVVVPAGGGLGRDAAARPPEPAPVLRPVPGFALPAEAVAPHERFEEPVAFAGLSGESTAAMSYLPLSGTLIGELPAGLAASLIDPVALDEVFADLAAVVQAGAIRSGGAWLVAAALVAAAGEMTRRQLRRAATRAAGAALNELDEPPVGWLPAGDAADA